MGLRRARRPPSPSWGTRVCVTAWLLAPLPVFASASDPPPPSSGMVTNEMEAPLVVNGRLLGELWVRVDMAGKGEVDAVRLAALLRTVLTEPVWSALHQRIAGRANVPLAELAGLPVTIAFDPGELQVVVTATPDQIRATQIDIAGYAPPDLGSYARQARFAGGVGIAAEQEWREARPDRGRGPLRLTLDGFATVGGFPGVTLRGGGEFVERSGRGGFDFTRSPIRLMTDLFGPAVHLAAGEITPPAATFQGTAPILGIGIDRDYSGIRPFDNIRPAARGSIVLDRRSTVTVEVNGLETRKLFLEPGRYELTSITGTFGASQARLYVEDELGRREVANASFFNSSTMLGAGLTDFGAAAGKLGTGQGRYAGPLVATGYVRHGFANRFTLGGGAQVGGGDWLVSGEVILGTPIGAFRLEAAESRVDRHRGRTASLDWLQTTEAGGGKLNLLLAASATSRNFGSPLDGGLRVNDMRWRVDGRADWQHGRWGAIAAASFGQTRSGTGQQGVSLTAYFSSQHVSVTGLVGADKFGTKAWEPRVMVGLSFRLGARDNLSLRGDSYRSTASLEYSRYPRDEVGDISGRVRVERDDRKSGATASIRYFGNRLVLSADQDWYSSTNSVVQDERLTRVRLATFLGLADGAISLGRPPTYGFAIFDPHSSLAEAAITMRDEAGYVVGRRDFLGRPLVPFNRAFAPVELNADVDPLPPGYDIGDPRLVAFPGNASAYRVRIGSDAWHVATGYLLTSDGPLAARSGTVEKIGDPAFAPRPFYTNSAGRFAADQLSSGEYRMMIEGQEVARFKVDATTKGITDVGKIQIATP